MSRRVFDPADYDIPLHREAFTDRVVEEFHALYRDSLSIDELLLHPSEAMHFCDLVRRKFAYYGVPDNVILRVIIQRRKSGRRGGGEGG